MIRSSKYSYDTITFKTDKASLFITIERDPPIDGCIFYMCYDSTITRIAGTTLEKFEKGLKKMFLPVTGPRKRIVWNGVPYFASINFMGPHATMVAEQVDNHGVRLHFITGKYGEYLPATLDLSPADMKHWLEVIHQYQIDHPMT